MLAFLVACRADRASNPKSGMRGKGDKEHSVLRASSKGIQCGFSLIKVAPPLSIVIYVCWSHGIMLSSCGLVLK